MSKKSIDDYITYTNKLCEKNLSYADLETTLWNVKELMQSESQNITVKTIYERIKESNDIARLVVQKGWDKNTPERIFDGYSSQKKIILKCINDTPKWDVKLQVSPNIMLADIPEVLFVIYNHIKAHSTTDYETFNATNILLKIENHISTCMKEFDVRYKNTPHYKHPLKNKFVNKK